MKQIVLDSWQQEVLDYDGNIVLCTGRQNGKTTIMSRKAAEYMLSHPGSKIIIVSLTEDQAKLIVVMILDYLERNYPKEIKKGKDKPTQNKVTLRNGSSCIARPVGNTGDAVRGFTGDVLIIDEASRMPKLAFEASKPVLFTTKGKIWMCSTPAGKQGYFYESFLNEQGRYRVWHINSEKVAHERPISEGWTEEQRTSAIAFLEAEKQSKSKNYYGQEYLALFLDDLRQYFDDDLINKVCKARKETRNPKYTYYIGHDLARMGGDQFTTEVIKKETQKQYKHVENFYIKNIDTVRNEELIKEANKIWNPHKIGIDAGAGTLGVSIYDHLMQDETIRGKLIAMNNRQVSLDRRGEKKQRIMKEDYYDNLKAMMERGEVTLLDDDEVRLSLKSVQFEFIDSNDPENGTKKTTVRIFGNYTHIVEGLARALWLAVHEKSLNFDITYI